MAVCIPVCIGALIPWNASEVICSSLLKENHCSLGLTAIKFWRRSPICLPRRFTRVEWPLFKFGLPSSVPALRTSACVWLSAAVLAVSARADVCPCSAGVVSGDFSPAATLLRPAANADATYHVEELGDKGVKLISNNLENNYALTLSGSNSDADTGLEALAPGEAWHKSLGVELEGKVGALLNTDFRTNFTEVERNSSAELFGLQSLDASADNRRALEEFDATTKFMGDRVTFTSSRRTSSLVPLGAGADDSKGTSEQDRFSAYLLAIGSEQSLCRRRVEPD